MINIPGVKAIAWDLDGTIIDSFKVFEELTREACAAVGREAPNQDVFLRNFHGSLEDSIRAVLNLRTDEELQEVHDYFLKNQERYYDNLEGQLFEDALVLSERAAAMGLPQVVVTNRAHKGRGSASPHSIVARSLLSGRIDEVRSGDDPDSYRKPDPRALAGWLDKHDISPNNLLIVGDQLVDAQFAVALNARAVLVRRQDEIHYLDQLPEVDRTRVMIVSSLHDVVITQTA